MQDRRRSALLAADADVATFNLTRIKSIQTGHSGREYAQGSKVETKENFLRKNTHISNMRIFSGKRGKYIYER